MSLDAPVGDLLKRTGRIGVELLDPVTLGLVRGGVTVSGGFDRPPRQSLGGRFFWLEEHGGWPAEIRVDPGRLPYMAETFPIGAEPGATDLPSARIVRLTLRPSPIYPFPDGVTVVRGLLAETGARDAAPIADAMLWLARLRDLPSGESWEDAPVRVNSAAGGDFAVFMRPARASAATEDGPTDFRIVATHDGATRVHRLTLEEGVFTEFGALPLGWDAMTPI